MTIYAAPLRDMRFVTHDVFDAATKLTALPGYEEASEDLIDADATKRARTERAMDAIKAKFGTKSVETGITFKNE